MKKYWLVLCIACLSACNAISPTMSEKTSEPEQIAHRILKKMRAEDQVWGDYTLDLSLDALLALYEATGNISYKDYVLAIHFRRNIKLEDPRNWKSEPFGHLSYRLFTVTQDERLKTAFLKASEDALSEVARTSHGLVKHPAPEHKTPSVLIDFMQAYASRMAQAGALKNDPQMLQESLQQFRLYRDLLSHHEHKLWSQGQGWESENPKTLSPQTWSRGQGWILRGMVDALEALPEGSALHAELLSYFQELVDALIPFQNEEGMWHAIPHLSHERSDPETSGTALICWALYRGITQGWLSGEPYEASANKAFRAIAKRVQQDGTVIEACEGPGPLNTSWLKHYLDTSFKPDEPHGRFAVLYACAGRAAYLKNQ